MKSSFHSTRHGQGGARLRFLCVVACLTILSATASATTEVIGRVVGVSDGDTITVLDAQKVQHKIRLSGIDAPESSQAFGRRSKEHLSNLVFGQTVTVVAEKSDRYGRTLGKVLVNRQDANLAQVQAGLAWHYKKYANQQPSADRASYARTEEHARQNRLGLWRDDNPTPPWDFRRSKGKTSTVSGGD